MSNESGPDSYNRLMRHVAVVLISAGFVLLLVPVYNYLFSAKGVVEEGTSQATNEPNITSVGQIAEIPKAADLQAEINRLKGQLASKNAEPKQRDGESPTTVKDVVRTEERNEARQSA